MSSRRARFLFLCLLAIFVLTQLIFLHWGVEALFFVTWLFLALTVQHDSRISAAVGLAFLATCPFLLIAKRDAVAEQAANYAYFFLAMGVLVQLEEMVLERYGWLNRKLDFSYLWRPAGETFRRHSATTLQALGQQLKLADRTELVRLIQIVGTAGLALAFIGAALSNGQLAVVLPLLGGAVLFPFLVWGVRLALRALGAAWLLRTALALVVLPLAATELVWLHYLLAADQLARLAVTYDFIAYRDEAIHPVPLGEGESVEAQVWTIDGLTRRVLYQHPAFAGSSRLLYQARVGRDGKLAFDAALAPESWKLEGDGVGFVIYLVVDGNTQQVFSAYVDPKHNEADQHWHPHVIDLSAYAGKMITFIFETDVGPMGDYRNDWAGWGEPRLLGGK